MDVYKKYKKYKKWELDFISSIDYNNGYMWVCKKCKQKILIDESVNPDKINCPNCNKKE